MTKLQVKERPKPSCDVWTSNSQIVCESAQTRFHIKSPPCLFIKKSVLRLARPNFLTGAIIQTRIQASLLAPPGCVRNWTSLYLVDFAAREESKSWKMQRLSMDLVLPRESSARMKAVRRTRQILFLILPRRTERLK